MKRTKLTEEQETAIKAAKAAYHKQWHKNNPTKSKIYANRYWLKQSKLMNN
jgi:hypothetical protein